MSLGWCSFGATIAIDGQEPGYVVRKLAEVGPTPVPLAVCFLLTYLRNAHQSVPGSFRLMW